MSIVTNINNELDNKISKILTKYKKNDNTKITNLVLSGGGIKGIAIAGSLKTLHENMLLDNIESIAEILSCIEVFALKLNFSDLIVPNPANILESLSLDTGERAEFVLTKMIESKGLNKNITLKEVYNIKKIKLIMTATCLNNSQIYYNSYITTPDMPLLTCMMMTSAVPIIFKPIKYKDKSYIDGGIMDNYPIHLFKDDIKRTLGIYVKSCCEYKHSIADIASYASSILTCAAEGQALNYIQTYSNNSLVIELTTMSLLNAIDIKIKKEIYNTGCEITKQYIFNNLQKKS